MKEALQLTITLTGVDQKIWRRIQIEPKATLWDLHIAIQDSMGWENAHLHAFIAKSKESRSVIEEFGIPDDTFDTAMSPSWEQEAAKLLKSEDITLEYEYDFGDSWIHEINFEGIFIVGDGKPLPHCLDGEMNCPPEDCGGSHIFNEMQKALLGKEYDEHLMSEEWKDWLPENYDVSDFDYSYPQFNDPKKLLEEMLGRC